MTRRKRVVIALSIIIPGALLLLIFGADLGNIREYIQGFSHGLSTGGDAGDTNAAYQGTVGSPRSMVDLLKAGDASACAQDDVKQTLISEVTPEQKEDDNRFITDAGKAISFDLEDIVATGINADVHGISCEASVIIRATGYDDKRFSIEYQILPEIASNSAVVHGYADDATQYAKNLRDSIASAAASEYANDSNMARCLAFNPDWVRRHPSYLAAHASVAELLPDEQKSMIEHPLSPNDFSVTNSIQCGGLVNDHSSELNGNDETPASEQPN